MPKGKILRIAIAALSIVAFALIVKYSLNNTTSSNNTNSNLNIPGWKNFSHAQTGLNFQYPAGKTLREFQDPFEIRIIDFRDPHLGDARATGAVAGPGKIGITKLDKYYANPQEYLTSSFTLRAEITTSTIAGGPAYRVTYAQPLEEHSDDLVVYVFNSAGETWVARLDKKDSAETVVDEFERIVATIQIKAHPTPEREGNTNGS